MLRKKKNKRGIINEEVPHVSEACARKQVICGAVGFILGLVLTNIFRPGSEQLLEMLVVIGVVSSFTLGGMKLAKWMDGHPIKFRGW